MNNHAHSAAAIAATLLIFFSPPSVHAAVPLRWTVETSRVQPAVFDVVHGETIELEAAFQSYGKPIATSNQTAFIAWQTNGMDTAWWITNAVTSGTSAKALFTPDMDPGAPTITGFIGLSDSTNTPLFTSSLPSSPSLSYRAAFTLRFRKGPGARPNVIEQPPRVLDLAHTVVINQPWPTQADFAATTTVMRAELKTYVDTEIEGSGLLTHLAVTNISGRVASNVVTKTYVEGLGIESGLDTNAVATVITNHVTSGYLCTVASAKSLIDSEVGGTNVLKSFASEVIGKTWQWNMAFDKAMTHDTKAPSWDSAASQTATLSSNMGSLQTQVAAIGAHLNSEDAHFVATNYDSTVRLPEAYVEIKMSNTWITIWREMTRWNRFAGTNFNWNAWGDFKTWSDNVESELDAKADRAWGAYDSETGGYSPDGYTQISSSNILICAGMAYQRKIVTGGAVWVLQCNTGVAHVGADTNGFFRVIDGDGVTQFEIIKGDKQEMGADATGITVDNSTTPPTVTIPYSVESEAHPTIQVCTDLTLADWKAEDNAQCAATVSWAGTSGAYVATVRAKTAPAPKLFVRATYWNGGETYINNVAPVSMQYIYLGGHKYSVSVKTVAGETVLGLTQVN